MEFSIKQQELIIKRYEQSYLKKPGWLKDLSLEIGKSPQNISRFARKIDITSKNRKKFSKRTFVSKKCIVCGKSFKLIKGAKRSTCGDKKCIEYISSHKWQFYPHPKGMLGKKKTAEACTKQSEQMRKKWADKNSAFNSKEHKQIQSNIMSARMTKTMSKSNNYSRTIKGWMIFGDRKYFMRSKWEMNYSCYLEFLKKHKEIIDWEYECQTFWFEKIKRGVRSYTPDFKITEKSGKIVFHEVKGWMDPKSITKIKRMKKYYPDIKLIVVDEDQYKELKKQSKLFKGWQ